MTTTTTIVPSSSVAGSWELVQPLPVNGATYVEPKILATAVAGYLAGDANATGLVQDKLVLPDVGVSVGQVDLIGTGKLDYTGTYATTWNVPTPTMFPGYTVKAGDLFVVDGASLELTDPGPPTTPASPWQTRGSFWTATPYVPRITRFFKMATADGESGAVTVTGPSNRMHWTCRVLRGVDIAAYFDAALPSNTHGQGSKPNPASIVTATAGAYVETIVAGNASGGIGTPPPGYTQGVSFTTGIDRGFGQAWTRRPTPGTEDPGQWGGTLENWRAITDVYKPAVNSGLTVVVLGLASDTTATAIPSPAPFTAQSEVQRITSVLTSGTFTLTYSGQTTSAIAFDASAGTIQAALIALSNIGATDVSCFGGPLHQGPVTVVFQDGLANQDLPLITTSSGSVTVVETERGHPVYTFTWEGSVNCPRWADGAAWLAGSAPQVNIWALRPPSYIPGTEIDVTVSDHDGNQTWSLILLVVKDADPSNPISDLFGSAAGALAASSIPFGEITPLVPGSKVVAVLGQSTAGIYSSPPSNSVPARYRQVARAVSDRSVLSAFMSPPISAGSAEAFTPTTYYNNFSAASGVSTGPALTVLGSEWEVYEATPGNGGFGARRANRANVVAEGTSADGGQVLRLSAQNVGGVHHHAGVKLKLPFTYGEMECRVRVSDDPTMVTSGVVIFWPESDVWPRDGEIDWSETFTNRDTRTPMQSYVHRLNPAATPPYDAADDEVVVSYQHTGVDQSAWHKLQCRWTPNHLSISLDNGPFTVLTYDPDDIPDWPMEVTFQLDAWSNTPPASPVTMDVDYVLLRSYVPAVTPERPGVVSWPGAQDVVAGIMALNPAGSAGTLTMPQVLASRSLTTWVELAPAAGSMFEVIEFDLSGLPANPWLLSARLDFAHSSNVRNPIRAALVGIKDDGSYVSAVEQRPGGYFAEPLGQIQTQVGSVVTEFSDGSPISDYTRLGVAFGSAERHPELESHKLYWAECILTFEAGRPVVSGVSGPTAPGDPITWTYSSSSGLAQAEYEVMVIAGSGQDPETATAAASGLMATTGQIIYRERFQGSSARSLTLTDDPLSRGLSTVAVRAWAMASTGSLIPSEWATANFDITGTPPAVPPQVGSWSVVGHQIIQPGGAPLRSAGMNWSVPVYLPDGHPSKFGGTGAKHTGWADEGYTAHNGVGSTYQLMPDTQVGQWPKSIGPGAGYQVTVGGFLTQYEAWQGDPAPGVTAPSPTGWVTTPDKAAAMIGNLTTAAQGLGVTMPPRNWKNRNIRVGALLRSLGTVGAGNNRTWVTADDPNPIVPADTIPRYIEQVQAHLDLGFTVWLEDHSYQLAFNTVLPAGFVADPTMDWTALPAGLVKDTAQFYAEVIAEFQGTGQALILGLPNEPYTTGRSTDFDDMVVTWIRYIRHLGWTGLISWPTAHWSGDIGPVARGEYESLFVRLESHGVGHDLVMEQHLYGADWDAGGTGVTMTYANLLAYLTALRDGIPGSGRKVCCVFTEYGKTQPEGTGLIGARQVSGVDILVSDVYGTPLYRLFPDINIMFWKGSGDHTFARTFALGRGWANLGADPNIADPDVFHSGHYSGTISAWDLMYLPEEILYDWFSEAGALHYEASQWMGALTSPTSGTLAMLNTERGTVDVQVVVPVGATRAWLIRQRPGANWETVGDGPFTVTSGAAAILIDAWAPLMVEGIQYAVSFDSGPMTETTSPVTLGGPVDTDTTAWYLVSPTEPTLSTRIEVAGVRRVQPIRSVVASQPGGSVVATSRPLPEEITLDLRARNASERRAIDAALTSGRALRLINILGQEWLVRVSGDISRDLQRWAPLNTERTGLRDAHVISVSFTEVTR